MSDADAGIEGDYDRGTVTYSRFNDSCAACVQSRPSGKSYLCALKNMRVFADSTCSAFEPRDASVPGVTLDIRRALYRANLRVEPAVDQHMEMRARIAAANAGRTG
ncbi:MAG TPA: hypothetical protein VJN22_02185 [Candidatus Eremiobacteraceae bacterium]|nr:hypothetical protein [Candidatus Eremiobacteraceae bacterium]